MALLVRIILAAVLVVAAALKVRAPTETASSFSSYDVPQTLRLPTAVGVAVVELVVAVGLLVGAPFAPLVGSALFAVFALATTRALLRGKRGAPCGCFGGRSRIGWPAVARDVTFAVTLAAVPVLPTTFPSPVGWLALGLAGAFVCIVGLSLAVVALIRELGVLRLRLPPDVALDIPDEGPAVGSRVDLPPAVGAPLTLAVFSSHGCRLCRALEPAVAAFASEPSLTVNVYDELRDADIWERLRVPGSPYAVAIDRHGEVRAKGTFNSYGQLEAIVEAALA